MLLVGTKSGLVDLDAGRTLIDGLAVTALAPGPGGWHALLDGQSVVRLEDGEVTTIGTMPVADGQSLAVLTDGTVVVGRTGARLGLVSSQVDDVVAFDHVPGRDGWENPANPTPDTRSMASRGDNLWVNVHVGGLWRSRDTGKSWQHVIEPEADIHEVRAENGSVAVAAAIGFGWSQDGGSSWSWNTEGLHGRYLRAVAVDEGTAYVSASDGPFSKRGAVYRGRLGSVFSRCEHGLPEWFPGNVDTGRLDASDDRVAIGFKDVLYLSHDQGVSWETTEELPAMITTVRLGQS